MREPLAVVDLDERETPPFQVPDAGVSVGISTGMPPDGRVADRLDLAITSAPDPPAPWVHCADVEAEVQHLLSRCASRPIASAVLVQVLRSVEGLEARGGLVVESLAYSTLQAGPEFAGWLAGRPPPRPRAAGPGPAVMIEREGPVLFVTLNRPAVHNAYNTEMRGLLLNALEVAAADPGVAEVVLRGAGPSFCSGGDLTEFGTFPDPASAHLSRTRHSPALMIRSMSARVTARLHGSCVGSGVELPAFAGRVVADPGARFRLPELELGLLPGAGGTVSVSRRIGRHRTAWLVLGGRFLDAATALRWGLVDELEPVAPPAGE